MKKRYLFLAGLALAAASAFWFYARSPSLPSQYILTADNIVTMDPKHPDPEAIVVRDGRIAALGPKATLLAKQTLPVLHYNGTLTPGLIEPHTHPIASALLGAALDISSFKHSDRDSMMAALADAADKPAITPWLIAYGWDPVALPGLTPPTLQELDEIAPDRPILILTQMLHDAYVNSAAIKASGLKLSSHHLHETEAVNQVVATIPPPSPAVSELLLRRQMARYARAGYTSIGITGAVGRHHDPIGLLHKLSTEDRSPLRSYVYLLEQQQNHTHFGTDPSFAILGTKFWMDGSPFTGGAATAAPYADTEFVTHHLNLSALHLAPLNHSASDLINKARVRHQKGQQIALHTQGERAIDMALDIIEALQAEHPRPKLQHRLEHNALITQPQLKRAAELGVTLGFFIDHIAYYGPALPQLFGDERAARYMPAASAIRHGVTVTLHGDHPAVPIDPVRSMITATTRQSRDGSITIAADEALTQTQALRAMTLNPAIQLGQALELGSLSVGKQADFTLWSADPTRAKLDQLHVLGTWKSGQPVDTRVVSWLRPSLIWQALAQAF